MPVGVLAATLSVGSLVGLAVYLADRLAGVPPVPAPGVRWRAYLTLGIRAAITGLVIAGLWVR